MKKNSRSSNKKKMNLDFHLLPKLLNQETPTQSHKEGEQWYLSGGSAVVDLGTCLLCRSQIYDTLLSGLFLFPPLLPSHQVEKPFIWKCKNWSLYYWVYSYLNSFTSFHWHQAETFSYFINFAERCSELRNFSWKSVLFLNIIPSVTRGPAWQVSTFLRE